MYHVQIFHNNFSKNFSLDFISFTLLSIKTPKKRDFSQTHLGFFFYFATVSALLYLATMVTMVLFLSCKVDREDCVSGPVLCSDICTVNPQLFQIRAQKSH